MACGGAGRGERGQATTETMMMLTFLLILIVGLGTFSMLVATKEMLDYAAFAAARSVLVGGDQDEAARQVMDASLRWSGATAPTVSGADCQSTPAGMVRNGLQVSMKVAFGWPLFQDAPANGVEIDSPVACTVQDDFGESGDNAGDYSF